MILFLIYVIGVFGLAYILGHSIATKWIREWGWGFRILRIPISLVECPACFGFWIGLIAGAIGIVPFGLHGPPWVVAVTWGLFTSGSNLILAKLTGLMD